MNLSQPQYDFLSTPAEFAVYGGAAGGGKTHALTLDPLRHCQGPTAVKDFRGAIFRRTAPQLSKSGGLIDHTKIMYKPLGAVFNHTYSQWRFPVGAQIELSTCQFVKDLDNFQGAQFAFLGIDEATHFEEQMVFYLQGRCRTTCGVKPVVRLTCNPDNDSWLFPFLYWWINPTTGFPISERSGVVRHFTRLNEKLEWYDEPQYDQKTGKKISKSSTFIPATLDDNTVLDEQNPEYRQNLESLSEAERSRFLDGCWLASSKTGTEWPRELFLDLYVTLDQYPVPQFREVVRMFSVDPSKGRHVGKGDFSAIVCLAQTSELAYVDADLARRHPSQIIEDLFLFCDQAHHRIRSGDLIGIESLQFQSLFQDMIYLYAKDHPEYALSRYLISGNPIIPVEDMLPKAMRIRRLGSKITKREFRFLQNPGTTLLLQQLKQFDGNNVKGQHDDGPDALDQAQQLPRHRQEMYKK